MPKMEMNVKELGALETLVLNSVCDLSGPCERDVVNRVGKLAQRCRGSGKRAVLYDANGRAFDENGKRCGLGEDKFSDGDLVVGPREKGDFLEGIVVYDLETDTYGAVIIQDRVFELDEDWGEHVSRMSPADI